MRPLPMAPPGPKGAIPTIAEKLPLLEGRELSKLVEGALQTKLPSKDMEVVCYLLRRSYGEGFGEALHRRGD